jgi:hypothetical protein
MFEIQYRYFFDSTVKSFGYFDSIESVKQKFVEILGEDVDFAPDCRFEYNHLHVKRHGIFIWLNEHDNAANKRRWYISRCKRNSDIP